MHTAQSNCTNDEKTFSYSRVAQHSSYKLRLVAEGDLRTTTGHRYFWSRDDAGRRSHLPGGNWNRRKSEKNVAHLNCWSKIKFEDEDSESGFDEANDRRGRELISLLHVGQRTRMYM